MTHKRSTPMEQAIEWMVRLSSGAADGALMEAFRNWSASSPENARAAEEVRAAWALSGMALLAPTGLAGKRERRAVGAGDAMAWSVIAAHRGGLHWHAGVNA